MNNLTSITSTKAIGFVLFPQELERLLGGRKEYRKNEISGYMDSDGAMLPFSSRMSGLCN